MIYDLFKIILTSLSELDKLTIIFGVTTGAIVLIVVGVLLYKFVFKKMFEKKKKDIDKE